MMDAKKALERPESKVVGWKARIVLAALTACGLMFGPWVTFFKWNWLQPALFGAAVAVTAAWFIRRMATEPAPLGFGLSMAIGEASWGDTSRFRFAAKVYATFAGMVAVWWLVVGLNALVSFIQTLAVPSATKYALPAAYWAERGHATQEILPFSAVYSAAVAFFLGIFLAACVAYDVQLRRLAKQEERLRAEKAAAVLAEEDKLRQLEVRGERASSLVNRAVGILQTDKRSGDKAIGQAREMLEEALGFLNGQPTTEQIRREMYSRLDYSTCPAEMAVEIVDAAMEHTPRAPTAVCKLRVWAKFLRADQLQNGRQELLAGWCDRAATVKFSAE